MTMTDEIKHFELMLAGWQKSDSRGRAPTVTFILQSDEDVEFFEALTCAKGRPGVKKGRDAHVAGQIFDAAFRISLDDPQAQRMPPATESAPAHKRYGKLAAALHSSGFFYVPEVLRALGSDEEYAEWVRGQPCVVCGGADFDPETAEIRNEAAHVLRAGLPPSRQGDHPNKPAYFQIPLCHEDHALQHTKGESEAYKKHLVCAGKDDDVSDHAAVIEAAKSWFMSQRAKHVKTWAAERLRHQLGCESLSEASPFLVREWAAEMAAETFLPSEYIGETYE